MISNYEVERTRIVNILVRDKRFEEKTFIHYDNLSNSLVFRMFNVLSGNEVNHIDEVKSLPSKHSPERSDVLNSFALHTDGNNLNYFFILFLFRQALCTLLWPVFQLFY